MILKQKSQKVYLSKLTYNNTFRRTASKEDRVRNVFKDFPSSPEKSKSSQPNDQKSSTETRIKQATEKSSNIILIENQGESKAKDYSRTSVKLKIGTDLNCSLEKLNKKLKLALEEQLNLEIDSPLKQIDDPMRISELTLGPGDLSKQFKTFDSQKSNHKDKFLERTKGCDTGSITSEVRNDFLEPISNLSRISYKHNPEDSN